MQQAEQVRICSASLTLAVYHSDNSGWAHVFITEPLETSAPVLSTSTCHHPEDLLVYLKLLHRPCPLSLQLHEVNPKARMLVEGQGQTFKAAGSVASLAVLVPV